jgi:hypothetical protein
VTTSRPPADPSQDPGPEPDRRANNNLRFHGQIAYTPGQRVTHAAAEANGWLDETTPITTD